MQYQAVIGLELHIQLNTESKLFSSSSTRFGELQNVNVNEIDLAYPGVLPVLNKEAVKHAILFARALGSHINPHAIFMRKNYFYPDLPKGYQISQLDDAIIQGGEVAILVDGKKKTIRINRGQLEEDAGKSVHDIFSNKTGIDLNRAGVALIELVSEPDMNSAEQAVAYMRKIHHLVRYLGISDGNMQEGSFRCDANVSVREKGKTTLNNRVELKNINSFRFVEQAINIEIARQTEILSEGGVVAQETRLFDADRQETRPMRSKEEANDYRYFPDPDLLPLKLDDEFISAVIAALPELPDKREARYRESYHLSDDAIEFFLDNRPLADYLDELSKEISPSLAANWLQNEMQKLLTKQTITTVAAFPVAPRALAGLLTLVVNKEISATAAKKVFREMWETGASADALIARDNLLQNNDYDALTQWVDEVLQANEKQVQHYLAGQEKMLGFFVGQVLKRSQGKANPQRVNEIIREKLDVLKKTGLN